MTEIGDCLHEYVNKAVEEWMTKHGGGMVGGYAIIVDYFNSDGEASWATAHSEKQTFSRTLGLLEFHRLSVETDARNYLTEE